MRGEVRFTISEVLNRVLNVLSRLDMKQTKRRKRGRSQKVSRPVFFVIRPTATDKLWEYNIFFIFALCLKHFKMSECGERGESDSRDIFVFYSTQSNLRFKFSV